MPTAKLDPPFRAEHIGSFLRPPALAQARADFAAGKISAAALRTGEDGAIRDFVALQERIGFKVVTDGEFRRGTYTDNFTTSGLSGLTVEYAGQGAWTYTDASGDVRPGRIPTVSGRIRWNNSQNAQDFAFVNNVAKAMPKITLPGPCYIHFRAGRERISREVYPDLDGFWSDIVAAYEIELGKLRDAGCRYVQLDETSIAKFGDPKIRDALDARGDPWRALLAIYVDVINQVVRRAPKDMRIGLHLCRGNMAGHWQAEGGYDVVAQQLFRDLDIDFFFLEYDSERAGSFEPLRVLPSHKVVVLGLVSTKVAELESAEALEARIREATRYASLDQLAISPQCGFASADGANPVMGEKRAVEKLERVVEVARRVWGG